MSDHRAAEGDEALELRLVEERPLPSAGFRSRVRTEIVSSPERRSVRPSRLAIAAYGTSGTALLLLATVGVAGVGPLAP